MPREERTAEPSASGAVPSLDRVQRWLQAVIVHPGTVERRSPSPEAPPRCPPAGSRTSCGPPGR